MCKQWYNRKQKIWTIPAKKRAVFAVPHSAMSTTETRREGRRRVECEGDAMFSRETDASWRNGSMWRHCMMGSSLWRHNVTSFGDVIVHYRASFINNACDVIGRPCAKRTVSFSRRGAHVPPSLSIEKCSLIDVMRTVQTFGVCLVLVSLVFCS